MTQNDTRLDTWKQIAEYLKKDVRTVIRWEKERGLPVHRVPGEKRSSVYAWSSEIQLWLDGEGAEHPSPNGFGLAAAPPSAAVLPAEARRPISRVGILAAASTLLIGCSVLLVTLGSRPPARLFNPVQLTSDGLAKEFLVATADAIFFTSSLNGAGTITRFGLNDSKTRPLSFTGKHIEILDVSPDGSELLTIDRGTTGYTGPAWLVPVAGGLARRFANIVASGAAWSPDGRKLAFARERELYLAHADGTVPRRLVTLPLQAIRLTWSPDGRRLRFGVFGQGKSGLYQVSIDSRIVDRVFPEWPGDQGAAGQWSSDGKYFIFDRIRDRISDLWAMREPAGWFDWGGRSPFRLTNSVNGVEQPVFSKNGKKVYSISSEPRRGELMRYDPRGKRFVSYPDQAGLSAGQISFSPDGNQAAYISYPGSDLWTMRADGSDRRMLTDQAALPAWSPDGRQIAFMRATEDTRLPTKIRLISSDGGDLREPVRQPEWQGGPAWTADGKQLIFGENAPYFPVRASCSIHRFDLVTGKTSDIPGSTGLWTARTCPAGRYIAALTYNDRRLMLYDEKSASWRELAGFGDSRVGENPTWSADGRYIYFDAPEAKEPAIYRIRIPNGRVEWVASLKGIQRDENPGTWTGLAPGDLPMVVRRMGKTEIYSWDWIAP